VQGQERNGPTASILATTEWDHSPFLGGVAVNLKLNYDRSSEQANANARALIRTFLERGGFELQINCLSLQTLKDAQRNPEAYQDLVVRIGGYSAFFTRQTPMMQQEIINRTEHAV
jgi:trans-4-hydroxy-L-proline dehydratase